MHCKARKDLCDLVSTNQGNGSKWHLWQELIKSASKIWKPSYDCMTWCRQDSVDSDGRFETLTNSGKVWGSLTWAYKLKALKSAW